MPLPFLAILGLGAAALLGTGAHLDAKDTNEKAQSTIKDAHRIYNNAKKSLEAEQKKTEKALLSLGYTKKNVLETSVAQFLRAYEHIKDIELTESSGINEIANMKIEKKGVMELQEMSSIYSSTFSSGVAGAATGAVVALAASGSLPIVTGVLSTAGTAIAAGEIGVAAGLAGSALSFGAAMTPLAAIAAPAVLFSGISSSIKADENLEKARRSYAEAELAVEKMETAGTLCRAIAKKSQMFDGLLNELNTMFSKCTSLLEGVVTEKEGIINNKKITINDLSEEEKNLIAVTGSLATAVKTVLDTPILNKNGKVSQNAQKAYNKTTELLPYFSEKVEKIENTKFAAKPLVIKSNIDKYSSDKTNNVISNPLMSASEKISKDNQTTGDPFIDELTSLRDMLNPVIDAELENDCYYDAVHLRKDINNAILRYKTRNAQYATREEVSDENIPGLSRDEKGRIAPFTSLPSQAKYMAEVMPDRFTYDLYTDINRDNIQNVLIGNENFSNNYFKGYINYLKALTLDALNEFENDSKENEI